jgi:hypothetical protein
VGLQDTGEEVDADVGIFVEWTARIFAKRDAGYFNDPTWRGTPMSSCAPEPSDPAHDQRPL